MTDTTASATEKSLKEVKDEMWKDLYKASIECENTKCRKKPADGEKFKTCGKCRVSHYCSVECQKKVWPLHKISCGNLGTKKQKKQWLLLTRLFISAHKNKINTYAKAISREKKLPLNKLIINFQFDEVSGSVHDHKKFFNEMDRMMKDGSVPYVAIPGVEMLYPFLSEEDVKRQKENKNAYILTLTRGELIQTCVMLK
jgi:hypothetical protein